MVTIFSTPKPFQGHIGIIQRNAITSWTALRPRPEIILFGNEPGTSEICRELELKHDADVACAQFSSPLLSDVFERAQKLATHDVLCYVNADILLLSDFPAALNQIAMHRRKFLMVGRRWDVRVDELWDFGNGGWELRLRDFVLQNGTQAAMPGNSDFFVFPRGLWQAIPPLAIGRGWWERWLVYEARRLGATVIDASPAVMAVHQTHDQSSYPHGLRQWRKETNSNRRIAGDEAGRFCLYDASQLLGPSGLETPRGLRYWVRRVDTLPLFHPYLAAPLRAPKLAASSIRKLRQKIALSRNPFARLVGLVQSQLPGDGVTAVLGLAGPTDQQPEEDSLGLRLAHALLWGGFPVVLYDPDLPAMQEAQRSLTGPLELANSASGCARQGDVVVVAEQRDEFRNVPLDLLAMRDGPRVVIDCCGLLREAQGVEGLKYLSWNRG